MFGLYMLGLYLIARVISCVIDCKTDIDSRNKAREEGKKTWVDRHAVTHHVENDEPFMLVTDFKSRDVMEINPYTGEKIRNVSQNYREKREREKRAEAISNGMRLYAFEPDNINYSHRTDAIKGIRWKDVYTGDIYVARNYNTADVLFLNLKTGLYDYYDDLYSENMTKSEMQHKIDTINQGQKILIDQFGIGERSPIWRNDLCAVMCRKPRCRKENYV